MKHPRHSSIVWTLFIGIVIIVMFATSAMAEPCDPWAAKLVSIQGEATVKRHTQTEWNPIGFDELICMGDTLRVGQNSRVSVLLAGEGLIRVDQLTTLHFPASDTTNSFWVDLMEGVIHFFSHKPRHLKVLTPFVNGNVEGTEFVVTAGADQAEITVLQGRVRAINPSGELLLAAGQTAMAKKGTAPVYATKVRPEDAVQWALYYPMVNDFNDANLKESKIKAVKEALANYRQGNPSKALALLQEIPQVSDNVQLLNFRAGLNLMVGRVAEALEDTRHALQLKPNFSETLALQSIIAVVQNRKEEALKLAQKAVDTNPHSANGHIALSYAQQADFQIDAALQSVEQATTVAPENAVVWSRLAELRLSKGELNKALTAARNAIEFDPNNAHAQTVLGYAYLTQIKVDPAIEAFHKAIGLNQAAPLPRLGLGLATIRKGDLTKGRREIEIAASLDSQNALIRSYLGKAYFDEKQDKLAGDQYEMAKALDSHDPTAWFYDALRKQTANRPVEALQDLQKSIELNDNRAVYRSRLLLDQDLAARSASLGRIYNDLGFQQLALAEGWKSLNTDPSNYSAHRFLADSYAALPRHEVARVSELLQSQLLQPLNLTPVQPQLADSSQFFLDGSNAGSLSFNEFGPLFTRDRLAFSANGFFAENSTLGNDLVVSALYNHLSFSLGQFHYETDGFRENNDQERDDYELFFQTALSPQTSILFDARHSDKEKGDLPLRFSFDEADNFSENLRNDRQEDSIRLGLRHSFSPHSHLISHLTYVSAEETGKDIFGGVLPIEIQSDDSGYVAELQHLYKKDHLNFISGAGFFDSDRDQTIRFFGEDFSTVEVRHTNAYLYSQMTYPENIEWTFGVSADFLEDEEIKDQDQINPKIGVTFNPFEKTTLRAAAFRTLKRPLAAQQTLEPTQVAGFNQFYDDPDGTKVWRYGIAIDHTFSDRLYGGAEYSERDLERPSIDLDLDRVDFDDWREKVMRSYFYWAPHPRWAFSAEYLFEQFEREGFTGFEQISELDTHRFPLGVNYFHPLGLSLNVGLSWVDQEGTFGTEPADFRQGSDQFWLLDAAINFKCPKRFGTISIGAKNITDETFIFQDTDLSKMDIYPQRVFFGKISLSF